MTEWLARVAGLRTGEGRLAFLGALQFFLLMFAYFMLRPLRDAMGLEGNVEELSTLFLINVGVMAALSPVFGWVASRAPRRALTVIVYRFAIVCLGVFALILWESGGEATRGVGRVFYVWLSVLNVFLISLFWSLMADLQRPEQSRRVFGVVAIGGTVGAIVGSALVGGTAWTPSLISVVGPIGLMLGAAALLECGARVTRLHRVEHMVGSDTPERIGGSAWAGLAAMARSPYLLGIGLYILMHTSVSTFVYFEKVGIVEQAREGTEARTEIFGQITLYGQLLAALFQLVLTGRMLRRLGVGTLLCIVPALSLAGFAALEFSSGVLVIAVFEGARNATHYAFGKPGRETLFTVLSTEDKYKAKSALDTFVYRGGDAASALAHQAVARAGAPFLWFVAPVCVAGMSVALWLGVQERRRERRGATGGPRAGSHTEQAVPA